ncbi:MAG TPA: VWA domain-containing protein [Blastocatellia bacterium]|nr:VWA domain-containing protein [Blastocatellia bacterium]
MRKAALTLLLLLITLSGVGNPQTAGSPPPGGAAAHFSGLDATILIDQSSSMWKSPQNDKNMHRIGQVKNLVYRLAEQVEGTALIHRLSIIDFGDTASVSLSNYGIRYNPADPGGALRDAKAVIERVVTPHDLIYTNTPDAMRQAINEYDLMERSGPLPDRRRVLLLITDGRPEVRGTRLEDLKASIARYAQELRDRKVGIWVVGINDSLNYWNEGDGAFWESIAGAGRARLAETASSKVFTIIQGIVDEWLGSSSSPFAGDEYACPPYLRRVVFSVNLGLPRSAIGMVDPDGNDIPLSSGGAGVIPGTFGRFVVDDPKPGTYKLKRDPSRSYTPRVELTSANIQRLSPARVAGMETPARFVFQATDSGGVPLQMLSEYPIDASLVVTSPTGAVTEIKTAFQGDGKFVAEWQPPQLGTYRVRLKGLVKLKSGADYDVFADNASSYDEVLEVNDLHPFFLQLDDPDPVGGIRTMKPQSTATLVLSLLDARHQKVSDVSSTIKEPATWLALQLLDKSGVPLPGAPTALVPDADGRFVTAVPVQLDWLKGEGWLTPGQVYFRVLAQPNRLSGANYLDSIQLPVEAETHRVGGDPLTVGPLSVRFSRWILWSLSLLAVAAAVGGLWVMAKWVLPGRRLWWSDYRKGRTVMVKVYDPDIDPDGYSAKKFSATSGSRFNYDRSLSVAIDGQSYIAKTFRIYRAPQTDRVDVDVRYSWQHDPKTFHTVRLYKDQVARLIGLPQDSFVIRLEEKP